MNVVDSSGWLEYIADGPNAGFFAPAIEDTKNLLVPAISLLEVFKRVMQQKDENAALQVAALMHQGEIVPLDSPVALLAAKLGLQNKLPLADSVMLASARMKDAILWTQDADFKGLAGVKYVAKHKDS